MLISTSGNSVVRSAKSAYQRGLRLTQGDSMIMPAGRVIPAAIRCFFHVHEERLGTYGFRVRRHVLISPEETGCSRVVGPDEPVTVGNGIVVDRTWCRTCAAAVDAESRRGHSPTRQPHAQPHTERTT